jgi:hypothetical protein
MVLFYYYFRELVRRILLNAVCLIKHGKKLILVAARSKACACGRSSAGITGSNPTVGMNVSLLSLLSFVRYRSLPRADPSSRGVLLCERVCVVRCNSNLFTCNE